MQENEYDAYGTDIAHHKEIEVEETSTQRAAVGELLLDDMFRNIPAHEQTSEQAARRQEYLSCEEVKPTEHRLSAKCQPTAGVALRKRTEHADGGP